MNYPRITVITPSFNQGEYLEQTIRSVLDQGYPNLEYIVADGGSTDQSIEILDRYASHLTHCLRGPDKGQSDAIDQALSRATGDLFGWINSDDWLAEGILHKLAEEYSANHDLYAFNVLAQQTDGTRYLMLNRGLSAKAILRDDRYAFSQPGLWFRPRAVRECGGIDTQFNYAFDWDLLIRYLVRYPSVRYIDSVGAYFRLHGQSKTVTEQLKSEPENNRFLQEIHRIRDKLERELPEEFANASRLGRLREPWNQRMIQLLDDNALSPVAVTWTLVREIFQQPSVRVSRRTAGSLLRVLSRFVRPQFWIKRHPV